MLSSIRVLDLTEALAGPYCTMLLGDLGADVIKIERPEGDQSRGWGPPFVSGESAYFLATNRNKRSLVLDLKRPADARTAQRLLARTDVFVTNMRTLDSLAAYGLDYAHAAATHPGLIYCAISGYGHSGPLAGRAGYDLVVQGEAGLMAATGAPGDTPARFPAPLADMSTGLYATTAILAALFARTTTGQGQFIDMTLYESQASWGLLLAGNYFATGNPPPQIGNAHGQIAPYQVFHARDRALIIAVGTPRHWERFCTVLGPAGAALAADPRYTDNAARLAHRATLIPALEAILATADADDWLTRLDAAEIPCGRINRFDETLHDPHLIARGLLVDLPHPLGFTHHSLANPLHLSATPPTYRRPPPRLGEHTAEILHELGADA